MNNSIATLPLSGVRVLDLSRVLAGPLCTAMLGDLGADVIKIERPEQGDETRGWGPPFDAAGMSAYFKSANRNKISLALDFTNASDLEQLRALVAHADVVVDNFLPGSLARLGIDVSALLERHARLVWCTISGFGAESSRPGYDFVTQAESGWMAITGEAHGEPQKVGVAMADVVAGKDAAIAILAALVGRNAAERGDQRHFDAECADAPATVRHLHIALQHSAVAALVNVAHNVLESGAPAARWGNAHPNLVPYQLFDSADRPIVLAVGSDSQWAACAKLLGLDDAAGAFTRNEGRVNHRRELIPRIASRLITRRSSEWLAEFGNAGVPCGVVRSVEEAITERGATREGGLPSAMGGTVRRPPPALNEQGDQVRAMGWDAFL